MTSLRGRAQEPHRSGATGLGRTDASRQHARAGSPSSVSISGLKVVTEAATGAYAVTAVIAAMAGARVHASRATPYGTAASRTPPPRRSLAQPVLSDG